MPTFGAYSINVTSQTLPHLESPWTRIEVPDKTFTFQRATDTSEVFSISGYIQLSTWALTLAEGEGLNTALKTTPSGVFVDGWGHSYSCLVDAYEFAYVPGANKMTFTITGRVIT
jgi:hypothetical protein